MNKHRNIKQQIRELQQIPDEQNLRLQICIRENEKIKQKASLLTGSPVSEDVTLDFINLKKIAIANSRLLSPQEMQNINEDHYDVILNCVDRKLLARKDPDRHSKLEKCNCSNIGPHRLKLLRFMLEHPNHPICVETIEGVYGNIASMTSSALAKAILDIRRCLWDGPYILTELTWGESVSYTGSVYMLDHKYKYLVIRYKI